MRLPYLRTTPQQADKSVGSFGGLNTQLVIMENEFSDMKNMSIDGYPAISVRQPRGVIQKTIGKPNGLIL